jgi:acyl-CoA dehydrogenase
MVAADDVISSDVDRVVVSALAGPSVSASPLEAAAWKIGAEVAGPLADEVDKEGRFPAESIAALREAGILAAFVPTELGGGGASMADVAGAVRALAAHCTSTALVLAMHSIEVFNLARHGTTPALRQVLRDVASEGLLLANANSEVGIGGDIGRSRCALEQRDGVLHLEKDALAISYGEYADAIVTIARPNPDAAETDQVMMVIRKSQYSLERTSDWNAMGLRGTCSSGFHLTADIDGDAVFPVPFSVISNDGAAQVRLVLYAAWVGLAEAAAAKAHAYVRAAARRSIGTLPPSAMRLAEMANDLQAARSLLLGSALRFEALDRVGDPEDAGLMMAIRSFKVSASELAVKTAAAALGICGMAGFRTDTPFSLDRIVRDAHGSLVMVSNDRLMSDNAQLLVARKSV